MTKCATSCLVFLIFFSVYFILVFLFVYCLLFISLLLPYVMVNKDYHKRLLFWAISRAKTVHMSAEIREYCNIQRFNASCDAGSVILMEHAVYGRQRVGRCIQDMETQGKCGVDVLTVADARCSGRQRCAIKLPDDDMYAMNACRESVSHLYAAYSCVSGIPYRHRRLSYQRRNRVWTFDPWPDQTRTLLTRWPDPVTECLCFELSDYFDDGVLLVNAFCQKSVQHTYTDHENCQHNIVNLLSIKSELVNKTTWKYYSIHNIPQIASWRILSPKATIKRVQKLLHRVKHRVYHTDPWSDPTRPAKIVDPKTRFQHCLI